MMEKEAEDVVVVNEEAVVKDADPQLDVALAAEDTAPPSSADGAVEDRTLTEDNDDEEDEMEDMPLLNYARLSGSLPRLPKRVPSERPSNPLRSSCTCSILAQVSLRGGANSLPGGGGGGGDVGGGGLAPGGEDGVFESDADLKAIPQLILVAGFQDGSIQIVEAETGREIVASQHLAIVEGRNSPQPPIVALSMDSSGTCLAAINDKGQAAVWEIRFTATSAIVEGGVGSTNTSDTASATTASDNPFASFLNTTFGGGLVPQAQATQSVNQTSEEESGSGNRRPVQLRLGSILQTTRLPYSTSYGKPTGLALDPAYRRRREKAMLVTFEDGRVVLTKRGLLFQRRNDAVLYQGLPSAKSSSRVSERGMEAIVWRGSIVAWADSTGVKLYDIEHMNRIAHIDRPSGARASLYPTISELRPSLVFETSSNLLLAWGDCVMTMHIVETIVQASSPASNPDPANLLMAGLGAAPSDSSGNSSSQVIKRRTVKCSMAWELDCIACGLAPLDADHLVVLGLVPTDESEGEVPEIGSNDIEVQVISRATGAVVYADVLPMIRLPSNFTPSKNGEMQESANTFALLSSFNLPRMDDAAEVEEEGTMVDQEFDFNIFATSAQKVTFEDSHLRWNLKSVAFEKEEVEEKEASEPEDNRSVTETDAERHEIDDDVEVAAEAQLGTPTIAEVEDEDEEEEEAGGHELDNDEDIDQGSVDSDDYEFIVRASGKKKESSFAPSVALPPYMIVVSSSDIVTVRLRDIDDAIHFALKSGKVGLAMQRGLRHKRELSRHDLNDIVDQYLKRVLRIDDEERLSIRRLRLAAEATPTLLGGNVLLWEKWVTEFSQIPGALFILRDFLPVRDPKLPEAVYQTVVDTLLKETTELMLSLSEGDSLSAEEAKRRFLNALVGWGPMQALRAKIKFLTYHQNKSKTDNAPSASVASLQLRDLEKLLNRRLFQTAAGYLQLPSSLPKQQLPQASAETVGIGSVIAHSLFDMVALVRSLSPEDTEEGGDETETKEDESAEDEKESPNGKTMITLETLAEVNMMMGNYEASLRTYLELGVLFPKKSLDDLETSAIRVVNDGDTAIQNDDSDQYYFVLAMVEFHHLHRCLLDSDFFEYADAGKDFIPPLIAMIQLIGLKQMGDFLVEHCVPPPVDSNYVTTDSLASRSSAGTESSLPRNGHETLPINFVSDQLTKSPPLLHWYLHLIFLRKPEMYVRFSTTSVPPRAVTDLHRTHLDLYIDYAVDKDSAQSLLGTEEYNLERKTTPLLSFLKAALPLGGIRPEEVRRLLESQRLDTVKSDGAEFPHSFAIELAYVIENYGNDSEEDARAVLELYLKGANSVTLATSYVQRNTEHATVLWNELIQYSLENSQLKSPDPSGGETKEDGSMFGSLMEAAALVGADLALLVTRIPQGMNVEGLRPRLVAAVGDYRLKLKMHQSANDVGNNEKVNLLRDLSHRSRRGTRVTMEQLGPDAESKMETALQNRRLPKESQEEQKQDDFLSRSRRKKKSLSERPDRYRLSVRLPMR